MSDTTHINLSPTVCAKIKQWAKRYPAEQQRSAVMAALHFAQEDNGGWLPEAVMNAVAEFLHLPAIAVYEVATFYGMYNLEPVGRHVINICTNLSCVLSGCDKIVDHLKKRLNVNFNETTADGKFTLREFECLAACASAPMFQIGKKYHEFLTPDKVDTILDELE
jgi:NADH-quinone oxidoreductase subunit E